MFWDNCKDTNNRQVIRGDDFTVNEVLHNVCYFLTENAAIDSAGLCNNRFALL